MDKGVKFIDTTVTKNPTIQDRNTPPLINPSKIDKRDKGDTNIS